METFDRPSVALMPSFKSSMRNATSLRSRRQRKAWGEAQRNPRFEAITVPARASGRQTGKVATTLMNLFPLSPASAGSEGSS